MVDLTTATDLSGLISNQNKLLDIINTNTIKWDSKADGVAFNKLSDYIDVEKSTINGNLTITKSDADTEVSIVADTGHSAVLNVGDKLKISSILTISKDALTSSSAFSLTSTDKISINSVIDAYTTYVDVNAPLNISKKTTINNLILENNTISLKDASTILKIQSSITETSGAYIVLTNKDYNDTPAYYDANASSFHVITNLDNRPSFSIYNDKTSKFYNTVSIPYLEISNVLTFKTPSNIDWVFSANNQSLELKSISSTGSSVSLGGNIIAFERATVGGKLVNDIARVHFGLTYTTGGSDYEITFDFQTNPYMKIKGDPVIGPRQTGWSNISIDASKINKDLNTIDPGSSPTLESLAKVVRALAHDMINHGLIGT